LGKFQFLSLEYPIIQNFETWHLQLRYHLKDVIIGKIYFLLVRIKIKHMELEIRRRESTGSGPNTYNESETLAKYEIMDGAPVRG
jgi:vacuolar protein sorting-associated protein 26